MDTNLVSKKIKIGIYLKIDQKNHEKNIFEKKKKNNSFKSVKSPASGKGNVQFPDSSDFENLPDFCTRCDVRLSPNCPKHNIFEEK